MNIRPIFYFFVWKYFVNLKSIHNKLVRFYVKQLKFNFSLWHQSSPMKYWWIAPYLFRLQTISYLQIDSRRPHVKHFLKNHDLSVFDLNLTMSGECAFDKDLFLMHSYVGVVHNVEISWFYYHAYFTWNQFLMILEVQNQPS